MSLRHLEYFFAPRSIALIGASRRPDSVGQVILQNLTAAGFAGRLDLVNPAAQEINGRTCAPSIAALDTPPELAIIAVKPEAALASVAALAARGTKAAIVITAGFAELGAEGEALQRQLLEAARPATMRIIGPNCIGVLSSAANLNASFAHRMSAPGGTAFITQSGAMLTSVLDWACARGIGFSHLVSLGAMSDVDFGDMLDFLAADTATTSVLLYIENITHARKFMSAARRCARLKPVIVVKAGRSNEGAGAARSHTGALAGSDRVTDAALRRAGLLRVKTMEDLFTTLEALSSRPRVTGNRLSIITNGGGAGVLATDHLIEEGLSLARLSTAAIDELDPVMPKAWSRANPIDILGDAGAARYEAALKSALEEEATDAVLVLNCPVAVTSSREAASAVVRTVEHQKAEGNTKPVFAAWLGADATAEGRKILDDAGLPVYTTPEHAVSAFAHLVRRERAQRLLMEVPPVSDRDAPHDKARAKAIIAAALETGREWLDPMDATEILKLYGIAAVDMRKAETPDEAQRIAAQIGFPVALKILSSDIIHKSDVGAVALNLKDASSVSKAAATMSLKLAETMPDAQIEGFLVQPMAAKSGAHELIIGLSEDPVFGPVILFGQGGTSVEVVDDQAIALPPLNRPLIEDLMSRTRIAKLLRGYRDRPPADKESLIRTIMAVQAIAVDLPEVKELDINPLWANEQGVWALDARIRIAREPRNGTERFSIKPYPAELVKDIEDRTGKIYQMRPIKPQDAFALKAAIVESDPNDIRMRFFSGFKAMPDALALRLTQIDYDREMAFVVVDRSTGNEEGAGVVRLSLDPDRKRGEYAVMVRSGLKGAGLGYRMMQEIIAYAKCTGVEEIFGDVLAENEAMLSMCAELGFQRSEHPQDGIYVVTLKL